jgi:hypothetical protein
MEKGVLDFSQEYFVEKKDERMGLFVLIADQLPSGALSNRVASHP